MRSYDTVIVGGGITGSSCALVLSRAGLRCLVVDSGSHPRFSLGEATLPVTSYSFDAIARRWDIPELGKVTHYTGLKETGCTGWPKSCFWFGYHEPGEPLSRSQELCIEVFRPPFGPDLHVLRSDLDSYLVNLLPKYGVDYQDHTAIDDFQARAEGATLTLERDGERERLQCNFVVDCSGMRSYFAKRFDLQDREKELRTNTRALFGHFVDVKFADDVLGPNPDLRMTRDAGTMHHLFEGGWIWSIRFDSGVTSVGVTYDRELHPLDESITPEQELANLLSRYPTMNDVLGDMKPVRPVVRTQRLQWRPRTILGDRFILAPSAAGFNDALYSTGLLSNVAFIARFAPIAQRAGATNDWGSENFRGIERQFFRELETIDRLVGGGYKALAAGYDVYRQHWRLWVALGNAMYMNRVAGALEDAEGPCGVHCAGIPVMDDLVDRMYAAVADPTLSSAEKSERCRKIMDPLRNPTGTNYEGAAQTKTVCVEGGKLGTMLRQIIWYGRLRRMDPKLRRATSWLRLVSWMRLRRHRSKEHQNRMAQPGAEASEFRAAYAFLERVSSGVNTGPLTDDPQLLWPNGRTAAPIGPAMRVHLDEIPPT